MTSPGTMLRSDRVRPVWAPHVVDRVASYDRLKKLADWFSRASSGGSKLDRLPSVGCAEDWLGTVLLATVLAAFFVFLVVLWLRGEPFASSRKPARARPGSAQLLAQLPEDSCPALDDPWAEAQRRRAAGDLAGAIIYLFAHQLLSLDRAGLIRLAPGWTGRQYVRWLRDPVLVDSLAATLCLFEESTTATGCHPRTNSNTSGAGPKQLEDRRNALEGSTMSHPLPSPRLLFFAVPCLMAILAGLRRRGPDTEYGSEPGNEPERDFGLRRDAQTARTRSPPRDPPDRRAGRMGGGNRPFRPLSRAARSRRGRMVSPMACRGPPSGG